MPAQGHFPRKRLCGVVPPPGATVVHVEDAGALNTTRRDRGAAPSGRLVGPPLNLDEALLTIPLLLAHAVRERGDKVALRVKRRGLYRETIWQELAEQVERIGRGLIALRVQPGDRVAIVGDPSPEWLLTDFAAQCIGAISYGL